MAYSVGLPAQLIKKNYLIIENPTNGRSTCTETVDAHIDNNAISFDQKRGSKLHRSSSFSVFGSNFVGLTLVPERRRRVSGGNGKYHQQSNLLRNPLVVRSGEIPDQDECHPSCPYRNYQNQNNQQQDTNQYYSQDYQRTGTAPCQTGYYDNSPPQQYYAPQGHQGYVPQGRTQAHSKERSASDCGCDPSPGKRAYRTPSSHYMEYREFQHSPKKNPALDRPQYEEYPAESHRSKRLERKASECSCDSDSLPERQPVQRTNRLQRKTSVCCCESNSPPARQQVQRTNRLERKESECCCSPGKRVQRNNQPEKNYYLRKPTPTAQTCPVRCHARSHVQAIPPPPAPKRKCPAATSPPPTCRKPAPRSRSTNSTKRGSKRRCSTCHERESYRYSDGEPTDYVERSHSATEVLRNPLVQSRLSCDGLPQESYSPECVQQKPRSCRKPKAEKRTSSRRGPPICSNETLMEKPVKSYRFSCPENGRCASCRKLCPKCNKIKAQSKKSASVKRCATSVAQKCCPTCGLLPMMPNISIPDVTSSNRIIYKTLGRCRPRKLPKTRYELTICCKKRCQGGRNSHYMAGTIATSLKRRAKAVIPGGNQVAPSRSYRQGQNVTSPIHTRNQSRAGHSYVSQERSSQPGQHRERSAAPQHFQMRSPPENLVQRSERRQSERESNPASLSQQRTKALTPIVNVPGPSRHHDSERGSFQSKEHSPQAHSYRSQPEPAHSHRSQPEPAHSSRSKPEPPSSSYRSQYGPAISNRGDPPSISPPYLEPALLDPQSNRRAASYLGTDVNPCYRGSFLKVRCSRESPQTRLNPIHQRGEKTKEQPKPSRTPGIVLPVKYNRLSQLHAWVFGDPFVTGHDSMGTWSWRQIFGRSKKRTKSTKPLKAKK